MRAALKSVRMNTPYHVIAGRMSTTLANLAPWQACETSHDMGLVCLV